MCITCGSSFSLIFKACLSLSSLNTSLQRSLGSACVPRGTCLGLAASPLMLKSAMRLASIRPAVLSPASRATMMLALPTCPPAAHPPPTRRRGTTIAIATPWPAEAPTRSRPVLGEPPRPLADVTAPLLAALGARTRTLWQLYLRSLASHPLLTKVICGTPQAQRCAREAAPLRASHLIASNERLSVRPLCPPACRLPPRLCVAASAIRWPRRWAGRRSAPSAC